jgi:hypothetical protein
VKPGTLELIASRQAPIEYLKLSNTNLPSFTVERFTDLNFKFLRKLRFNNVCSSALGLMELALQSTQNEFDLCLTVDNIKIHLLTHQLLQRTTHLQLSASMPIFISAVDNTNSPYQ